jgi:hypothetical protein
MQRIRNLFMLLLVALSALFGQSQNVTLVSRWAYGPCMAVALDGQKVYRSSGG